MQDLARLEEEQSRDRTPEEDMQLFSGTCADIRKNLKDMLDLKVRFDGRVSINSVP